jgi:RimJ/RimL family protein N-acetyltransferase
MNKNLHQNMELSMPALFRLETSRLFLRAFQDQDIEPFRLYRSDPEIAKYQGWKAPFSIEQATAFVNEMKSKKPAQPGEWYQVALELKTTGAMIGDCVFQCLHEDPRQAEIGFTLARSYQGKGYAREAVECLMGYLFDVLGLHRLRANCDPANLASSRLLESVGMRYEGCFVESLWFKDSWADEKWYAMLHKEWIAR